jgi:hypothetical protein
MEINIYSIVRADLQPLSVDAAVIQSHEIVAALTPEGTSISGLMKLFKSRIGIGEGKIGIEEFARLVKETSVYGKDKLLRRK